MYRVSRFNFPALLIIRKNVSHRTCFICGKGAFYKKQKFRLVAGTSETSK